MGRGEYFVDFFLIWNDGKHSTEETMIEGTIKSYYLTCLGGKTKFRRVKRWCCFKTERIRMVPGE